MASDCVSATVAHRRASARGPAGFTREVGRRALLALAQVHEAALGREPLQVERDAHAIRGRRAEVVVENHRRASYPSLYWAMMHSIAAQRTFTLPDARRASSARLATQPAARGAAHRRRPREASASSRKARCKPAAVLLLVVNHPARSHGGLHAAHRAPRRPRGPDQLSRRAHATRGIARPSARRCARPRRRSALAPERVEVLGRLPEYRTGTGYRVTPIVGWAEPPLAYQPDPHEVADVFEVPLAFLLDARNHRYESAFFKGRMRKYWAMPYGERFIWGATAGMLVTFQRILAGRWRRAELDRNERSYYSRRSHDDVRRPIRPPSGDARARRPARRSSPRPSSRRARRASSRSPSARSPSARACRRAGSSRTSARKLELQIAALDEAARQFTEAVFLPALKAPRGVKRLRGALRELDRVAAAREAARRLPDRRGHARVRPPARADARRGDRAPDASSSASCARRCSSPSRRASSRRAPIPARSPSSSFGIILVFYRSRAGARRARRPSAARRLAFERLDRTQPRRA